MVEGGGFEPPKAEPTDLQSAPFDRSGIPPIRYRKHIILTYLRSLVNAITIFFLQIPDNPVQGFARQKRCPPGIGSKAWSPQRDSNPRPADSYPLPFSRPRRFVRFGVWTFSSPYLTKNLFLLRLRWAV